MSCESHTAVATSEANLIRQRESGYISAKVMVQSESGQEANKRHSRPARPASPRQRLPVRENHHRAASWPSGSSMLQKKRRHKPVFSEARFPWPANERQCRRRRALEFWRYPVSTATAHASPCISHNADGLSLVTNATTSSRYEPIYIYRRPRSITALRSCRRPTWRRTGCALSAGQGPRYGKRMAYLDNYLSCTVGQIFRTSSLPFAISNGLISSLRCPATIILIVPGS